MTSGPAPETSGAAAVGAAVRGWLAERRRAVLARPIEVRGFGSPGLGRLVAMTEDATRVGDLLGGALDDPVGELAAEALEHGWVRRQIEVDAPDAVAAGLACAGRADLVVQDVATLPPALWEHLAEERRVVLVTTTHLAGPPVSSVLGDGDDDRNDVDAPRVRRAVRDLASTGRTAIALDTGTLVEVFDPPTVLVVVGGGVVAEALVGQAGLLGWATEVVDGGDEAERRIVALGPSGALVVLSHDREVDVPALLAGLASRAGYVGALGSSHTQSERAEQLRERGADDVARARIRGPAGLDLGGQAPAEIALAICAEVLALRAGRPATPLQERAAPTGS